MAMSTSEFNKIVETIFSLMRLSVSLSDVEKELACRNKWGKRQNINLEEFTTDELQILIDNWNKAEAAR